MPVLTLYIGASASEEDVACAFDMFKSTRPNTIECSRIDAKGPHGQQVAIIAVPTYADVDMLCSFNLIEGLDLLSPLDDYDLVVRPQYEEK